MASDSEHTNRPRPPQQTQGHKWPVVLLLGVVTLALTLTACGGESSTSTPGATTGSPSTTTSTPASTPTPEPTEATEVGETAGIGRETREYVEVLCSRRLTGRPATFTWGEAVDRQKELIDFFEKNEPPSEIQEMVEASLALSRIGLRFAEEQDRSLPYDSEALLENMEDPDEIEAVYRVSRAMESLDDALVKALTEC